MTKQSCRNCRFLAVEPNKAGKIVARKYSVYECTAPCMTIAEIPIPDCVKIEISHAFWRLENDGKIPRRFMTPDAGTECVTWEKRE